MYDALVCVLVTVTEDCSYVLICHAVSDSIVLMPLATEIMLCVYSLPFSL